MKKRLVFPIAIIILAAAVFGGWHFVFRQKAPEPVPVEKPKIKKVTQEPTGKVSYGCFDKKSIRAEYTEGISGAGGNVRLKLSDGREMTLPQTGNKNGSRYANDDQTFTYWRKGNGAFFLEGDASVTYANCVLIAPAPADATLPTAYSENEGGFSIRLSSGYVADDTYKYHALGPGKDIFGVKFTIPKTLAKGTNLSEDSYISVEKIPTAQNCSAEKFLAAAANSQIITENDMEYSLASTTGSAAGNRYEETVYAFLDTSPCLAVRYFIHYGVFENYPSGGTVRRFDQSALIKQFDAIRRTLVVNQ